MKWRKRGLIHGPDGRQSWARHHAFPPTPYPLDDELLRVFFAALDERNVGRVGYVDVRLDDPSEVVRVAREPVLDVGAPGCFDDNGVVPTCVLPVGDELWLYYTGYQLGEKVPYFQFLGLATSRDGGESFERRRRVPVLDRSDAETHTRASAFVHRDGELFRMYYSAGSAWTHSEAGKPLPVYDLRCLESEDGETWGHEGRVCVGLRAGEHAIARPWVVDSAGRRLMLYSYRTTARDSRLGCAVPADGLEWERRDEQVGIDVSADGWDSTAIAYGSVVAHRDATYLLYCGNERGATGFGYAELERW